MASLVSVMMPCYQAAETLPMAIASLRAQTWKDWEVVCVDDGSKDATWDLLQKAQRLDARVRIERFEKNRGRGAARQRCLELARGAYLSFLDSDDWLYPEKLEVQAKLLDERADLTLVSTGALITDGVDKPVGQTRRGARNGDTLTVVAFDRPEPPELLFPTTMLRLALAQATGFDPAFKRSQDSDFLIRLLLGRSYGVLRTLEYAYSQASAASREKTLEGYKYRAQSHMRHIRKDPARGVRTVAATAAKALVFQLAGDRGAAWLISRRWEKAEPSEVARFSGALAKVSEEKLRAFGN